MEIKETNLKFSGILTPRSSTKRIVGHHTASGDVSAATVHQWHQSRGYWGIGYHYLIRRDGTIERGRPEHIEGAHAPAANADSIAIVLAGNFMNYVPTPEQLKSLVWLVQDIRSRYPGLQVIGHKDIQPTACPGAMFPWDDLRGRLQASQAQTQETQGSTKEGDGVLLKDWEREFGEAAADSLHNKGLLFNPEDWKQKLGDPVPIWQSFVIQDRMTDPAFIRKQLEQHRISIIEKVKPAVPVIKGPKGLGSGVLIAPDTIVTNVHVAMIGENPQTGVLDQLTVEFYNGPTVKPESVTVPYGDGARDCAILKIPPVDVTPVKFADKPRPGEGVYVIGHPVGFIASAADGIISHDRRMTVVAGGNIRWIQTSAAINPGNSGGALVNDAGELVGMPTWKIFQTPEPRPVESMGFCLHLDEIKKVLAVSKQRTGFVNMGQPFITKE